VNVRQIAQGSMMKNVLITGAAGNIGGSLARHLSSLPGYRVIGVDNFKTGNRAKLPAEGESFRFVKADVNDWNDISSIFLSSNFEFVFHYAATVGVQRTLDNPIDVLADIHGIEHILKLSKSASVRRVFFSSSSEVYGEPVEIPQREETTPLNSRLPYAIVKNVGEAYMRSYWREFGLPYTILRFFNTYGPLQSQDFVISRFVRKALLEEDIPLYGGGTQTRTFCHVEDNLAFTSKLLENGIGINETINVGSDLEITIRELAEAVVAVTGSASKLVDYPALPEGDMTRRCPDNTRMREILGRDLIGLHDGLRDVIESARSEGAA
jgi:UDP-glucose 4-epimerase